MERQIGSLLAKVGLASAAVSVGVLARAGRRGVDARCEPLRGSSLAEGVDGMAALFPSLDVERLVALCTHFLRLARDQDRTEGAQFTANRLAAEISALCGGAIAQARTGTGAEVDSAIYALEDVVPQLERACECELRNMLLRP